MDDENKKQPGKPESGEPAEKPSGADEAASADSASPRPADGTGAGPDKKDASADAPPADDGPEGGKAPERPAAASRPAKPDRAKGAEPAPAKPQEAKPAAAKPAAKAAGAKPARKPVARRPRGPQYEDLEGDALADALRGEFGEAIEKTQKFLGQKIYTVNSDALYDCMVYLRDDPDRQFTYLVDLTALDHLEDERRFCLVYHLYSYEHLELIRVKSHLEIDEVAASVVSIWTVADWMEREVFDLFGIRFSGHPDLKRILLPDDWHGYPLRKDYDIKLQDQAWIQDHLRIRKIPS